MICCTPDLDKILLTQARFTLFATVSCTPVARAILLPNPLEVLLRVGSSPVGASHEG